MQPCREQGVLGLEPFERDGRRSGQAFDGGGAESGDVVLHERIAIADEPAVLAAGGAPHQRAVARIEFVHAMRGLDHLGPRHRQATDVAHHDAIGTARDDAHAAEAAVGAADQHDDGNAGGAHVEQRAHHLGHRDEARIRLVQPHAA